MRGFDSINVFAAEEPHILNHLDAEERVGVLRLLKTADELPLRVAIDYIDQELYWYRSCLKRWGAQATLETNANEFWKEVYAENFLAERIESFVPGFDDRNALLGEALSLRKHVRVLRLNNLMPPMRVNYGEVTDQLATQIMYRAATTPEMEEALKMLNRTRSEAAAVNRGGLSRGMDHDDIINELERRLRTRQASYRRQVSQNTLEEKDSEEDEDRQRKLSTKIIRLRGVQVCGKPSPIFS